ncbi:MAG: hypothetical protein H6738_10370 [Alphaproteobacteria bacterium]|nr:hypothetical protein [Alphaproteobacteria bacterium]
MLIAWLAVGALATSTSDTDTTCSPARLRSSLPEDGDVGVRPDAVITLVFDTSPHCGGAFFSGTLTTADTEVELPFATETDPAGRVVTLVPDDPLEVGERYLLSGVVPTRDVVMDFEVGEQGLPMTDPPSEVTLGAQQRCEDFAFTHLVETVRFDRTRRGLLQTRLTTDGITGPWTTRAAIGPETTLRFEEDLIGTGHEHCLGARLLDEVGEVVWVEEEVVACASTTACPATSASGGCSTTGRSGAALAPLVLLALRRRRARC